MQVTVTCGLWTSSQGKKKMVENPNNLVGYPWLDGYQKLTLWKERQDYCLYTCYRILMRTSPNFNGERNGNYPVLGLAGEQSEGS